MGKKVVYIFLDIDGVLNSYTSAMAINRKYNKMSRLELFYRYKLVNFLEKIRIIDPRSHRDTLSYDISPYLLDNLTYLCDVLTNSKYCQPSKGYNYDLKIVISSTWRLGLTIKHLRKLFKSRGFAYWDHIIGKTPNLRSEKLVRGDEIKNWLDNNVVKGPYDFVILDDDSDMSVVKDHLIQTDSDRGLDYKNVCLALYFLTRDKCWWKEIKV